MVVAEPKVSIAEQVIDLWKQIPQDYAENNLELNFVSPLFRILGLDNISQVQSRVSLGRGAGLKPDYLIYNDVSKPPVLVIENKKRTSE